MEIITSKSNAKVMNAKKLKDKKFREEFGLFLVETKKVIAEVINCGLKCKMLFVLDGKNNIFDNSIETYILSQSVFNELSSLVSPDGYIAVFEKKPKQKKYDGGKFLVLDCLQNPDNMGAILRTATASGFKQIYTINSVDEYNEKVIRSSMGNQFKLDIIKINYSDISALFKSAKLYALDMKGENLFDIESFEKNVGFVVGNEGNGLSNEVKSLITNFVAIPMQNNVESLNASISAGLVMYYVFSKYSK